MIVIGIDPGINGGVAWYIVGLEEYGCIPMPATRKQLYDELNKFSDYTMTAVVEKIASRPGQGVASMFKFGKGVGEILGILTALGAEIHEPTPQAWKKVVLAGTDKSKNAAIQVAENLYPNINLVLPRCRKPHDGMADAVCLMHYGRVATNGK